MAKIDLYDPKWIDMVFADKNKAYGAYQLRKGTAGRNIKALIILLITALLIGGFLAYKVIQQQKDAERQAYMEQMELSKLKEQAKREKKEQPKIEAKVEPKKVVEQVRETQKYTAPVIKKDELVNDENQLKQAEDLDKDVAVGAKDQEGVKDRTVEAIRNDIAVNVPKEEPKQEVAQKVFDVVEQMPMFPGGPAALKEYLAKNVKYPIPAQENGISGRVVISFVVETDGSITQVQVAKPVDPLLDKEAARVVSSMPKWVPGQQNGQKVRVKYNVPVNFKLQ
ncbi:MAG: TonB family protein [Prevotella sp.]|jgi:protein TonB|nr:TonB family protein [Prevotella sp.]MBQ1836733.1 TonB family protein [Paludibacteraceae bacterium]MBQ5971251.1 TonB family protein [Prevotella sp.]MBQ6162655.1 TonB family protein [Prevotella sp.]MBQ6186324.1 TonB family protein [Prevotella sp.]